MSSANDIANLLERIADTAKGLNSKLIYLIAFSALASLYLAWTVYSAESSLMWNIVKCGLLAVPSLVWIFIWSVLAQLQQAPTLVKNLLADDQSVSANLETSNVPQPSGIASLFRALRAFRREDGLSIVWETVSGIGMLANPLFAIVAFIALGLLFIIIFAALLLFIF